MKHSAVRLLLVACLLANLTGCNSSGSEDFLSSGRALLEKRDYAAAVIQLKNAVQKHEGSGEARYWLGVALSRSGDLVAGEIELRKALSSGFSPDTTLPALLSVLLELSAFEKVLRDADVSKVTAPRARADVLAARAVAMLANGKIEDARKLADDAARADESSASPFVVRARLALVDHKLEDAQRFLATALTKATDDYDALRLKADLTLAQGQTKEAVALYDKVLTLRPGSIGTYLMLVPALLRDGDIEGASSRLTTLKKVAGGSTGARYLEALVAYSKGDRKATRDAIRQVLKVGGDYPPALLLAGTVEYELGNYLVAEDLLGRTAAAVPKDTRARRLLISTYLRTNQVKKAQDALSALMKVDPDSASTNLLAGQVANAAREPAKAAVYFQKAVSLEPKNAIPRAMLGATSLARGDVERGLSELEAASASDTSRIEADVALVQYFLQQKQLDKAAQAVESLARKQPNNPQAANLRGGVLLAQGKVNEARKSFEEALKLGPTFVPAASNLAALDLKDKKPEDAANRYRSVLAKDPKQVEASLMLAVLLQHNGGKPDEIDKVLAGAVSADPASVLARLAHIGHLQQTGRKKEAQDAAQQAIAALPDEPRLLLLLGRAQSANGEHSQAAATFGKLAILEPKSVEPLVLQASAYAGAKDFVSARSVLRRAVELKPDNVMLRAGLVDLGLAEHQPDKAISDAREIQKEWPKLSAGYIAEAMVLTSQGKSQEAEALLRATARTVEDSGAAIQLFSLLTNAGRSAEADKFVVEWMASRPKDVAVAATAAQNSLARADYPTAVRWYQAALKAKPNSPMLLNNLAWALGQLKDPQAMVMAEKARALAPDSAPIIDTVGWLQLQKGDAATAVTTLSRAVALAPASAAIRINLAKALIATGNKEAAKEQLLAVSSLASSPQSVRDEAEKLLGSL